MSGAQYTLAGGLSVALPPAEAFELFTPRGEERWVDGWSPRFPMDAADDSAPGTVFETDADGRTTTWVVVGREAGRWISYARVTPGRRAGTVTVEVSADDRGGSDVGVTYELTALSPEGEEELREFADGYAGFLGSWEEAIARQGGLSIGHRRV
ncbi:hypothetical protein SAMN05444920_114209 [Nonomuraea solani]|uniref:Polyketide cyclase / dehydrase and lipid transport n=1 Tax=Nonomuraea solani TaxID=1144553 RepID=A0A1H6ER90_9ACTN|nr:SRPBCC family protein [Nonomuraea solani]SEG99933.1 hypothetical protein SAMN05444920_114209 [Nonomuraea solani]